MHCMGYRRHREQQDRDHARWLHRHHSELVACGLSDETFRTWQEWDYFLRNGNTGWGGFHVSRLDSTHQQRLRTLLTNLYRHSDSSPPLLGVLNALLKGTRVEAVA